MDTKLKGYGVVQYTENGDLKSLSETGFQYNGDHLDMFVNENGDIEYMTLTNDEIKDLMNIDQREMPLLQQIETHHNVKHKKRENKKSRKKSHKKNQKKGKKSHKKSHKKHSKKENKKTHKKSKKKSQKKSQEKGKKSNIKKVKIIDNKSKSKSKKNNLQKVLRLTPYNRNNIEIPFIEDIQKTIY